MLAYIALNPSGLKYVLNISTAVPINLNAPVTISLLLTISPNHLTTLAVTSITPPNKKPRALKAVPR